MLYRALNVNITLPGQAALYPQLFNEIAQEILSPPVTLSATDLGH